MSYIDEMMDYNKSFVDGKKYEAYATTKYPNKKIAVLTCMDTRLTDILPAALNFKNGDIKMIKNAGAVVSHPFGSVMRSILIAIYDLEVDDILVIGHNDCGMQQLDPNKFIEKMIARNIEPSTIELVSNCGTPLNKWLKGFDKVEDSVRDTVSVIKQHPLIPNDVKVHGFVIDIETGKLTKL